MTPQAIRLALILCFPFSMILAVINLLVYWSEFEVNVFTFIGIDDVLMLALKPLAMILLSGLLVNGIMFKFFGSPLIRVRPHNPQHLAASDYFLSRRAKLAIAILSLATFIAIGYWLTSIFMFILLLLTGALVGIAAIQLDKNPNLVELIPEPAVRHFLVMTLAGCLIFSAFAGYMESRAIVSGDRYLTVAESPCGERLVGKAGNFFFFYNPINGAVRLERSESVASLTLFRKVKAKCIR